jgi:hypothetical protein
VSEVDREADGENPLPSLERVSQRMRDRLELIFDAFRQGGVLLTPDEAMKELDLVLGTLSETWGPIEFSVLTSRFDKIAFRCLVHHYAVDIYYRLQRPSRTKGRRGAPPLTDEYLDRILRLTKERKSHKEIATEVGLTGPRAKDRIRHQIKIAVKRWNDVTARIRELGAKQVAKVSVSHTEAAVNNGSDSPRASRKRKRKPSRKARRNK